MNASTRKYKMWVGNNKIFITYFYDTKYYRFFLTLLYCSYQIGFLNDLLKTLKTPMTE